MIADDIKPGTLWRFIRPTTSEFYTSGEVYAAASNVGSDGMFRMDDNIHKGADARHHWNMSTFMQAFVPADVGWPVRTVTKSEIVPGHYGRIVVSKTDVAGCVGVGFDYANPCAACTAAEIRDAARVFIALAEALEETP